MTDENNKLTPPGLADKLAQSKSRRIGGGLAARVAAQASRPSPTAIDATVLPNRIALMLDLSGSMGSVEKNKAKIEHLRDAVLGFVQAADMGTTGISLTGFPNTVVTPLEANSQLITMSVLALNASGGTPMHEAMEYVMMHVPLTRGIIVSDGEADDRNRAIAMAHRFKESETIVDTVHIGDNTGGEELLKEIALITGGIFIKFDDVANFGKAFKFLTPGNRNLLLESGAAGLLGAKEVK